MTLRRDLLKTKRGAVLAQLPGGLAASRSFLQEALEALPDGFESYVDTVLCPDGATVAIDWDQPLLTVGRILQQDVCILQRRGEEHVMTGAVLCFPASWTLSQKIGQPLTRIHLPVDEYTDEIAKRVQRFFDGIQYGRPLWRANLLRYDDPSLYHPRPEHDPTPNGSPSSRYLRSERQTVVRLLEPGAVAFVIHTMVVRQSGSEQEISGGCANHRQ